MTIAAAWHEVTIGVDTFINADGDERPGWTFELGHPPECKGNYCLLEEEYWPPEFHEIPGAGPYRVRINHGAVTSALEWELA